MAIAHIAKNGHGQLELNQVAFRRDGRIEAQCKLGADFTEATPAENGMLLYIKNTEREVVLPTGESINKSHIALHYSAEHMYDERKPGLKEFYLVAGDYPRLGYLATGDKFTTNTVSYDTTVFANDAALWTYVAGENNITYGHASSDGYILVNKTAQGADLEVVKATTMPDGQKAIQFIAL